MSSPIASPDTPTVFELMHSWVELYMSGREFDASHDFAHVSRVLSLSRHILSVESSSSAPGAPAYDADIVDLAALLHDVDDRKYAVSTGTDIAEIRDMVRLTLSNAGATAATADAVQRICANVSYSHEARHPEQVELCLGEHPELAIVQDADRLDAIGAVGIARTFAYTGALSARGDDRGLDGTMRHFEEKLERVEKKMKTAEGRRLARLRTERLSTFRSWFEEEAEAPLAGVPGQIGKPEEAVI